MALSTQRKNGTLCTVRELLTTALWTSSFVLVAGCESCDFIRYMQAWKRRKKNKRKSLLILKVVQVWSVGQFFNVWVVLWTFVYPGRYLFTWVLLLLTRNNGHSLPEPRHTTAQLFHSSAVGFVSVLFLQVACCTLSSLSCHYLWLAAVI